MSARHHFACLALAQLGKPVVWNADGEDYFDCSGLVAWALWKAGGRDIRATHNAQRMHNETPDLSTLSDVIVPSPGDLIFYGSDLAGVSHVAIWLAGGRALSADGATSRQQDRRVALGNPACRVRIHETVRFRRDLPYLSIRRNTFIDAVEQPKEPAP